MGTATLVAPNYIVTAALVVKNDYYEIDPDDWKFICMMILVKPLTPMFIWLMK